MKINLLDHILAILDERDLRYQQRFEAQMLAINAALLAAKEAVIKAEVATGNKFESVNEFRKTLSDQAGTFTARTEFSSLKERMDRNEGKGSMAGVVWGGFIAVAGIAVAIAAIWIR